MNKTILMALGVIVVIGGIFYLYNRADDTALVNKDDVLNTATNTTTTTGTNGTSLENVVQLRETSTGNSVVVQRAELTVPGYVAIYRADSNGRTTLLGHTDLLKAGQHNIISVQLDTVIAKDQVIVAVLHKDDGDGKFEVPGADAYLTTGAQLATDVDVVDVPFTSESAALRAQAESYLDATLTASTTAE